MNKAIDQVGLLPCPQPIFGVRIKNLNDWQRYVSKLAFVEILHVI